MLSLLRRIHLGRYWVVNMGTYIFVIFASFVWGSWAMLPYSTPGFQEITYENIIFSIVPIIWALTMKKVFDFLVLKLDILLSNPKGSSQNE